MIVEIAQDIYSSVPDMMGTWAIICTRDYGAVPRVGEWIELAPGWAATRVKDVSFLADGRISVTLQPYKPGTRDGLVEHRQLVEVHGWKVLGGGPWSE